MERPTTRGLRPAVLVKQPTSGTCEIYMHASVTRPPPPSCWLGLLPPQSMAVDTRWFLSCRNFPTISRPAEAAHRSEMALRPPRIGLIFSSHLKPIEDRRVPSTHREPFVGRFQATESSIEASPATGLSTEPSSPAA